MFKSTRELVYIDKNEGVGKNSQKPYRNFKFADPTTFENFSLSADPTQIFANFSKGEKVHIGVDLVDFYGNTQVRLTDIQPVLTK